jgi:hypothetical protein
MSEQNIDLDTNSASQRFDADQVDIRTQRLGIFYFTISIVLTIAAAVGVYIGNIFLANLFLNAVSCYLCQDDWFGAGLLAFVPFVIELCILGGIGWFIYAMINPTEFMSKNRTST